jgi:diguanylate cyclase (GGDEF)-like protein
VQRSSAAAYNALSLWELVDELYVSAQELVPLCPLPVQAPALAVNRVLVRGEWATTLLETGREEQAAVQLARALEAAQAARDVALPALWARDVAAWETALGLLLGEAEDSDDDRLLATAAVQRRELAAAGDLESLPGLDACRALALLRAGRTAEATVVVDQLRDTPTSSSSGATSFLAWARARVLDPAAWDGPAGDYARLVAGQRWEARRAVLVAARSFVALARLQADHRRLTRDLALDVLTGLANRRAFEQWRALPPDTGTHAVLLLVDLDAFKAVNDTFGHRTGDDVLREVGRLIAEQVRPGDLASRHGGDEFVVAYGHPEATDEVALERGLALRRAVREHDWSALAPGLAVDVSIGVAVGALGDTADALYARADTALYAAKRGSAGVVLAPPTEPAGPAGAAGAAAAAGPAGRVPPEPRDGEVQDSALLGHPAPAVAVLALTTTDGTALDGAGTGAG